MKRIIKIIFISVCLLGMISLLFISERSESTAEDKNSIEILSSNINYKKYDSLMIVAHPDDETIWGANHLKNGNYLVICITNGDNETRSKEFYEVMKQVGSQGIMLTYPDKTNGKKDDWKSSKEAITKDIQYIIKQNHWKEIVTHNPDGEYGHPHHIMTNRIVTTLAKQNGYTNELYYFGKYIKKKQIPNYIEKEELSNPLSNIDIKGKEQLTKIYTSQKKVMGNLEHMFPYENWIAYHTWYNY